MLNLVAVACLDQLKTVVLEPRMPAVNWDLALLLPAWLLFVAAWLVVAWCGPLVADNRPRLQLDTADIDRQI
jgi:hypothetical protein